MAPGSKAMVAVCLLLRQAVLAVGFGWLRPRCVPRSAFPVLGQPARQSSHNVMGRRYKLKLCEQHFGRTHVRTCVHGLGEGSLSPVSGAVGVSDFECCAGFEGFRPRLYHP